MHIFVRFVFEDNKLYPKLFLDKILCSRNVKMNFGANKTPIEVIKEGAFGGTYSRGIYSGVTRNWLKKIMERIWSVEKYWSKIILLRLSWR